MTIKSPFLVYQDFLDPSTCDKIAQDVWVDLIPDHENKLNNSERFHGDSEQFIFDQFKKIVPELESHYTGFKYHGTEKLVFQQFPVTGKSAEEPQCQNAVYKRKKWTRINTRELTGVLWLKDYKSTPPFDLTTEVYGGKLEFPIYNFGFQAQKGTMVIYPANERFISLTSSILVGELQCVRFHICGEKLWLYDPSDYPGDFRTWFSDVV